MFIDVKIPRKVQLEFQNLQPESFSVSLEEEDQEVQMLYFQSILFAHLFLVHLFFLFCFFFLQIQNRNVLLQTLSIQSHKIDRSEFQIRAALSSM